MATVAGPNWLRKAGIELCGLGGMVVCPAEGCGCENVHYHAVLVSDGHRRMLVLPGGSSEEGTSAEQDGTGSAIRVAFHCEWGHLFLVSFMFDQGTMYAGVERIEGVALDEDGLGELPMEFWREG